LVLSIYGTSSLATEEPGSRFVDDQLGHQFGPQRGEQPRDLVAAADDADRPIDLVVEAQGRSAGAAVEGDILPGSVLPEEDGRQVPDYPLPLELLQISSGSRYPLEYT
jgi:hypothetical protein